ncbi:hypothetical protein D3C71_1594290 [compost metagenome]
MKKFKKSFVSCKCSLFAEIAKALPGASMNSFGSPLPLTLGNWKAPALPATEEASIAPVSHEPITHIAALPDLKILPPALASMEVAPSGNAPA